MAGGPGSYVFGAEEKKELMDVIEAGSLFRYGTPGVDGFQGKVATFEKEMAELLGHKHVVATNAGTSSLLACLAALGIGMGDEVIVPGYTFIASISTIIMMNAIPVLAEIDDSLTIDPDKIEELNAFRRENNVPEVKPMEYIRECFDKAMSNTDKNLKRKSDVTVKRASKSDAK